MALIDDVRKLTPAIRSLAPEIERERAVPEEIIQALAQRGVFRIAARPDVDVAAMVDVFEELGFADGSAGWCAMIGGATSMALTHLAPELGARMLADPRFLMAGVAAPSGKASVVDGGLKVSGRWAFASGVRHATWLVGGVIVPEWKAARLVVLPASEVEILDTWDVQGLRGTGSHDFSVRDVVVPDERILTLAPRPDEFPPLSLLAAGIGAVSLGIARAAIEAFGELARGKRNPMTGSALGDKASARSVVAEAEALRASGLSFLRTTMAAAGSTPEARAAQRLAILTATRHAARAVDLVYNAGGGSVVYAASPLQRHFRDVHVATQHAMVGPDVLETVGAVLLGAEIDTSRL